MKENWRKYLPWIALAGGIVIAVYGQELLNKFTGEFINGIGYKFKNAKFKLINGFTKLRFTCTMVITNKNPLGGKVNSFEGKLTYGRNGSEIVPINVGTFNLPPNGSAEAQVISEVALLSLASNVQNVVMAVIDGNWKKLWIKGQLKTTFVNIPIDSEASLLEE